MSCYNSSLLTAILVIAGLVSACSTPVAGSPLYERIDSAEPVSQDIDYVHGWYEGFDECKRSYDRIQATIHSILGTGA
jgi:hypothetical protein